MNLMIFSEHSTNMAHSRTSTALCLLLALAISLPKTTSNPQSSTIVTSKPATPKTTPNTTVITVPASDTDTNITVPSCAGSCGTTLIICGSCECNCPVCDSSSSSASLQVLNALSSFLSNSGFASAIPGVLTILGSAGVPGLEGIAAGGDAADILSQLPGLLSHGGA